MEKNIDKKRLLEGMERSEKALIDPSFADASSLDFLIRNFYGLCAYALTARASALPC